MLEKKDRLDHVPSKGYSGTPIFILLKFLELLIDTYLMFEIL